MYGECYQRGIVMYDGHRVLHVNTERQVVVFSHDTQVLAWARGALTGPRDKVVELAGPSSVRASHLPG